MESMHSFCQLGDDLRGQSKVSEDHKWIMAASKLAKHTRSKGECMNKLDLSKGLAELRPRDKLQLIIIEHYSNSIYLFVLYFLAE